MDRSNAALVTADATREGGEVGNRAALHRVTRDITTLRTLISNVCFIGTPGARSGEWVLVDAGVPGSASAIVRTAAKLFGDGSRPRGILLTHGHFDHVGALPALLRRWDVPVYAHPLEHPYLTGRSPYPPSDPTVGGGMMARLAPLYPRGPIDIRGSLEPLPSDGTVPSLRGWRWLHTPGHTAGHVSFYRDYDRVLVAGDAVVTVKQESALDVLRQRLHVSGPPAYLTQDWQQVRSSLERLHALDPEVLVAGHGPPVEGVAVSFGLDRLLRTYEQVVVPSSGRYVERPVIADEEGLVRVPPPRRPGSGRAIVVAAGLAALAGSLYLLGRRRTQDG